MAGHPAKYVSRRREVLAWRLRCRGKSLEQISEALAANELGKVSLAGVCKIIQRAERRSLRKLDRSIVIRRAQQVGSLDQMHDELWDAWERSKEAARLIREKETRDDHAPLPAPGEAPAMAARRPGRKETVHELRDQLGDRGYLAEARAALADIREMLGMNAETKVRNVHEFAGADAELEALFEREARPRPKAPATPHEPHNGQNGHGPGPDGLA